MRAVCPYTELRPETERALRRYAPVDVEFVDVSQKPDMYFRLLERLWAEAEPFVLVEHDIVVHEYVFPTFDSCPELWCSFTYKLEVGNAFGLGCTRFRAELQKATPDLFERIAEHTDTVPPRDWRRLDVRFWRELGFNPHLHEPQVGHVR